MGATMANEAPQPSDEPDTITALDRHRRLCTAVPFPQDLVWDGCDLTKDSRQRLYRFAQDLALSAIDWYNNKRRAKKTVSKSLRLSSYAFFIIGAALPLTKIFPVAETLSGSLGSRVMNISEVSAELALGLLGIAGGLHLIDRLIGASSGWMRYTVAAMKIQQKLLNFQFDWNELLGPKAPAQSAEDNGPPKNPDSDPKRPPEKAASDKGRAITLFELARDFCDNVVDSVADETEKWASEFSDSVAHFEKELPGSSLLRRKAG
jgi:hypothetical protein